MLSDSKTTCGKALYGLPVSPRLWNLQISSDLKRLGGQESLGEPGLWRQIQADGTMFATLSLYVDVAIILAETEAEAGRLVRQIHQIHPLVETEEKTPDKSKPITAEFDLLGSDCIYDPKNNYWKISMGSYVTRLLARFDMNHEGLKILPTPDFDESALYDGSSPGQPESEYWGCVGALQWAATVCRPDLASSTNCLARAAARSPTQAMANCCRRVLRYIAGTRAVGVEYSPSIEKKLYESLRGIAEHQENEQMDKSKLEHPITSYGNASFGSCYRTMRSVTGVIVYCYGCPVLWHSRPQTLFSGSTMESEWVACSTAIELATGPHLLLKFLNGSAKTVGSDLDEGPIICDNRSAVISGRKGIEGTNELTRPTRHLALRHQRVVENAKRLFFSLTDQVRADGFTKSSNGEALKIIFQPDSIKMPPVSANLVYEYCIFF